MRISRRTGRAIALAALLSSLVVTGCSITGTAGRGTGMMGDGTDYRTSTPTCSKPDSLPGTEVLVSLVDMGMSQAMGGDAPRGERMRLLSSSSLVPAGKVSFLVSNVGWRTHELVVLPLGEGVAAGKRVVGSDDAVSEDGSLGEASSSCGPDSGDGIVSGSAGWTTITLAPGRYELVCNLRNHYANGMRLAFVVS